MPKITAGELWPLADQVAMEAGVDPAFFRSIISAENSADGNLRADQMLDTNTLSPKGAYGIGQVMPSTYDGLVRTGRLPKDIDRSSIKGQLQAAAAALKETEIYAGNDPVMQAVRYNTSMETFNKFKQTGDMSALPAETQQYLQKIGKNYKTRISTTSIPSQLKDDLLGAAEKLDTRAQQITGDVQKLTSSFMNEGAEAASTAERLGEAKATSINATANIDKEKIRRQEMILDQFGINAFDPSSNLTALQQEAAVSQQATTNLLPEIEKLRQVQFLDNPLEWVASQFKLQPLVTQYNQQAQRFNTAAAVIGKRQELAHNQLGLQPTTSQAAIDEKALADANATREEAKFRGWAIQKELRSAQLSAYSTEMQMLGMSFSTAAQKAKILSERMSISEAKSEDERTLNAVNHRKAMMGMEPWTEGEFKSLTKAQQSDWISKSSTTQVSIDASPGASLVALENNNALTKYATARKNNEGAQFTADLFSQAKAQARTAALNNPNLKKPDDLMEAAVNGITDRWTGQLQFREYDKLPTDNPLRMRAQMFARAEGLETNTIAAYVRALPNGGAGTTEKEVSSYAKSQVAAGKPVAQVSRELEEYFRLGFSNQISQLGVSLLGMKITSPKGFVEYPMSEEVLTSFGSLRRMFGTNTSGIQGFNRASWEQGLTASRASDISYEANKTAGSLEPQLFAPASRVPN